MQSILETNVIFVVQSIIGNSPEIQQAIRDAGEETQDSVQFLENRIRDLTRSLANLQKRKSAYIQKMDILIGEDSTKEEIQIFRSEFRSLLDTVKSEQTEIEGQLRLAQNELTALKNISFEWSDVARHAQSVQQVMLEKDPVILKRSYNALFKAIVVGKEDGEGRRTVTYILRNSPESV